MNSNHIQTFENTEDNNLRFKLRAVTVDNQIWFVAQDVAVATGWTAMVGRPTPARDMAKHFKSAQKVEQVSELDGRTYTAEVLCFTPKGVINFAKRIQNIIYRPQTGEFLKWFRRKVLPTITELTDD